MKTIGLFNLINSGIAFIGSFLLLQFLGADIYGNFYYLSSLAIVIYTVVEFGFSNEIIVSKSIVIKNKRIYFEKFVATRIIITSILTLVIIPFLVFYDINDLSNILFVVTLIILLFLNKIIQTIYQSYKKWLFWGLVGLIIPLIKLVSLLRSNSFIWNNVLLQILFLTFTISFLIFKVRTINVSKNKKSVKSSLTFALINIFTILLLRLDVLWINHFLDNTLLGIYAFSNTVAMTLPIIVGTSINTYFTKSFSDRLDSKKIYPSKKIIILIIVMTLIGMIFSKPIIKFMVGPENIYKNILPILVFLHCIGIVFARFESYFLNLNPVIFLKARISQLLTLTISLFIIELLFRTNLTNVVICLLLTRIFYWMFCIYYSNTKINNT